MKELEEQITYYADSIATEIFDMPNFDLQNIRQVIKTRMMFSIKELFEFQSSNLEKKRNILVSELGEPSISGHRKEEVKRKLTALKPLHKSTNRVIHAFNQQEEKILLLRFIREKFGDDILEEFYTLQKNLNQQKQ